MEKCVLVFFLLFIVGIAEGAVVFGGGGGVQTSSCVLQGWLQSECDTCAVTSGAISSENQRCEQQRTLVCDQFEEFADNKQSDSWLICVNEEQGTSDATSKYKPRWVSKSVTWKLFPPATSTDWNRFAGNGPNCTCNEPYLLPPSSVGGSQDIIGSATSYERNDPRCGSNNVIVHVGYRSLKTSWLKVNPTDQNNVLVRLPRSTANPNFGNPTGWERVSGSGPGFPPTSFAPGVFYEGWMAYLTQTNNYYYGWLIDGVIVCLDHVSGCGGLVSIPPTAANERTDGWAAGLEQISGSNEVTMRYTWKPVCSGARNAATAVFPVRLPSSSDCNVASTDIALQGACVSDTPQPGVGGCVEFTTSLAGSEAITVDANCGDAFGASITIPDAVVPPTRPGFVGLVTSQSDCISWRGPMWKCGACLSSGLRCYDAGTNHDCRGSVGCWYRPGGDCSCEPCFSETCYGQTEWDPSVCRCAPCEANPSCLYADPASAGDSNPDYNCADANAVECTYAPSNLCESQCETCQVTQGCPNGWKSGAPGFPRKCNPCADCLDDTNAKNLCLYSTTNPSPNAVATGFYVKDGDTCKCLQCGIAGDWAATGGLWRDTPEPPSNQIYTPVCKPGVSPQDSKLLPSDGGLGEIGDLYYDPSVAPCECQSCKDLWSSFTPERFPDGTCAASGFKSSSNDCSTCFQCVGCPAGYTALLS